MKNIYPILILTVCWSLTAMAEQISGFEQPDDPNVCVPTISYHSPFQNYQPQGPIKLQSWFKANESVTNQPMDHTQHMNMPMGDTAAPSKADSHSNHQMKGSE
ncbi:hypothetical protein [Candidatus Berkiella aquae]|uniref:Uncharacterized protein n=1 Tax=Candidatus Berkiella aquae TaxID=295108 RepID=A0A0Q9YRI6_9GAMM|nr:hypothetical protein [Candidatus Berkiella aquae]MCS5712890.1 hypothetical protein [Candidatus Berkiella aquae]